MKHPVTWWQRNCVQGRAEVVLFWVLAVLVAGVLVLWGLQHD